MPRSIDAGWVSGASFNGCVTSTATPFLRKMSRYPSAVSNSWLRPFTTRGSPSCVFDTISKSVHIPSSYSSTAWNFDWFREPPLRMNAGYLGLEEREGLLNDELAGGVSGEHGSVAQQKLLCRLSTGEIHVLQVHPQHVRSKRRFKVI